MTFVSVAVAASSFGVSESTLLRRIRAGDVPAIVERGSWRIPKSALPVANAPAAITEPAGWFTEQTDRFVGLPPLLSPEQVCQITGLGLTAVRTAIRAGDFPVARVGKRKMVVTARLAAMLGLEMVA